MMGQRDRDLEPAAAARERIFAWLAVLAGVILAAAIVLLWRHWIK